MRLTHCIDLFVINWAFTRIQLTIMAKVLLPFFLLFIYYSSNAQPKSLQSDSVVVQASPKYQDPSFFRMLFMGKNYRKEWQTPVKLPVFKMKTMGFTPLELGGGMQTKSLRLADTKGKEWVLRTVDKNVEPNLPPKLKNTLAEAIVQDMISAAHPYAPLTIPPLAKSIGLLVASPVIYAIPDDPDFGEYRSVFANTICMLEEREAGHMGTETKSTEDVLKKLKAENDHLIMQQQVLKARLLDMLIGDWDRHADQWRWGKVDSGKLERYYAIPKDRDQAYFYSKGLLLKMVKLIAMKHLVSYNDDLNKLKKLSWKSWGFDKIFLNELSRKDWENEIKNVQQKLNDELLTNAFKKLPPEIYPLNGKVLEKKIKGRRDDLMRAGLKYYKFLSSRVAINGSEKKEIFQIKGDHDNFTITIYDDKDGKQGIKLYERKFDPDDTKFIDINGMGNNDQFIIDEDASSKIKLTIKGGAGADVYDLNGKVRNTVYDDKSDGNKVLNTSNSKLRIM